MDAKMINMSRLTKIFCLLTLLLTSCKTSETPIAPSVLPEQAITPAVEFRPSTTTSPTQEPFTISTDTTTQTLQPAVSDYFEPGNNPLTGLPVNDPARLERRPVMVKVSNWPREGRPHAGLTSADLVFEYYIGNQMNRFLAVYYGADADVIGPVRSGRLVDAQLVQLYQGILAYGSADPQVDAVLIDALGGRALSFPPVQCPAMCGETTHSATGVFANSAALTAYALESGVEKFVPDLQGMLFQDAPPSGDEAGTLLQVAYADFSIMQWHFDSEERNYVLWMERETESGLEMAPMTDRNNGQDVRFDNLVVMYAEYLEYTPSLHDIILTEAVGYHPALLFHDGGITFGQWQISEPDRPIQFEFPEGGALPLKPGKTWVVIVGLSSVTTQPAGGEWEIELDLP